MIKGGPEGVFRDQPDVFVAGDLFWYPVEGAPDIRTAPDVLVALDRPKGDRRSYQQWREGGISPQVVFEVVSPGNRVAEMIWKFLFYQRYGVREYYVYDPDIGELPRRPQASGVGPSDPKPRTPRVRRGARGSDDPPHCATERPTSELPRNEHEHDHDDERSLHRLCRENPGRQGPQRLPAPHAAG